SPSWESNVTLHSFLGKQRHVASLRPAVAAGTTAGHPCLSWTVRLVLAGPRLSTSPGNDLGYLGVCRAYDGWPGLGAAVGPRPGVVVGDDVHRAGGHRLDDPGDRGAFGGGRSWRVRRVPLALLDLSAG